VDVQLARQLGHADSRLALDHRQRPQLRPADARLALDLTEMGFDGIEDDAKLAQHTVRGCQAVDVMI
jgi:hypothetical protein